MKISLEELRKIVNEELSLVKEELDHNSVKSVVNAASNLLKALDTFSKSEPTAAMSTGTGSYIDALRKSLEDMIQNPVSYVDRPPPRVITVKKPKTVKVT
jgi:hypothetical protein